MFKRIEGTISCKCVWTLSRHIKARISCVVLTEYISLEFEGNKRWRGISICSCQCQYNYLNLVISRHSLHVDVKYLYIQYIDPGYYCPKIDISENFL